MIRFKKESMRDDLPNVHPELREVLTQFEAWSAKQGFPDPVITDLVRRPDAQVRIYTRFWRKLQEATSPQSPTFGTIDLEDDGTFRPLLETEKRTASEVKYLTDEQLRERAGLRFTWHSVRCACDLRTRHYTGAQLKEVRRWLGAHCTGKEIRRVLHSPGERKEQPKWELLYHDVTAPHLHCARCDDEWLTKYWEEGAPNSA